MIDASSIAGLRAGFLAELAAVASGADLKAIRDKYLGRKGGVLVGLLKQVAALPPDRRPVLGKAVNELKAEIEAILETRRAAVEAAARPASAIDVTLPGRELPLGHRHPLTIVRDRIEAIFTRMGYQVIEGPEVEDDYHNFEALNMPPEHPARDAQDTLYLAQPLPQNTPVTSPRGDPRGRGPATLLRTHTSGMQIRYMEAHEPPVRIIAPGRVYRRDSIDLTHTPMFSQVECLVVDEGITLADLKGTVQAFLRELFESSELRVLFRPSFFPYTEPSAEVFMSCAACGGSGCPVCKRTGWLEIGGSGMVHPAVFEFVGYDAERYTGFAFGFGFERMAILKYAVDDIRMFYENDLRFLEQFPH
jgi:phenylalanyl-tRNA synthetase alpha chain